MEEMAQSIQNDARAEFDAWADATEEGLKEPQDPKELQAELAAQKKLQCKQLAQKLGFMPSKHSAQGRQGLTFYIDKRIAKMAKANKEAWDSKLAEMSQRLQAEARAKVDAWVAVAEEEYTEPQKPEDLQTELAAQKKSHCKQLAANLDFMHRAHVEQARGQLTAHIDERLAKLIKMNKEAWDIKIAEMARQVQASARAEFDAWAAAVEQALKKEPLDPVEVPKLLADQKDTHCKKLAENLEFLPRMQLAQGRQDLAAYIDERFIKLAKVNQDAWNNQVFYKGVKNFAGDLANMAKNAAVDEIKKALNVQPAPPVISPIGQPVAPIFKAAAPTFKRDANGRWHDSKGHFASKAAVTAAGYSY